MRTLKNRLKINEMTRGSWVTVGEGFVFVGFCLDTLFLGTAIKERLQSI